MTVRSTELVRDIASRGEKLTMAIGTEFSDVKLTELAQAEIDALVRLVAERGVLVFRRQSMTLAEQVALGRRMGELALDLAPYPDSVHPEGYPEVITLHADAGSRHNQGGRWHSDRSFDARPPALSMLRIETVPSAGGDTVFSSMYRAYETLSEPMRELVAGLTVVHSGASVTQFLQGRTADSSVASSSSFPQHEHPLVRTHPITGRKALYVNSAFASRIPQLVTTNNRESDAVLRFLFDHVAYGVDFQVRVRWEADTMVWWDNRCVQHHATGDYFPETRHGYRVTTVGEAPE